MLFLCLVPLIRQTRHCHYVPIQMFQPNDPDIQGFIRERDYKVNLQYYKTTNGVNFNEKVNLRPFTATAQRNLQSDRPIFLNRRQEEQTNNLLYIVKPKNPEYKDQFFKKDYKDVKFKMPTTTCPVSIFGIKNNFS